MQESGYPACRIEQLAVAFKAEAQLPPPADVLVIAKYVH